MEKKYSSAIDLSGKNFGRLTVIKRIENYVTPGGQKLVQWLCKCDCGTFTKVLGGNLRKGHSKSCGCLARETTSKIKFIDITGNKYGRLLVLFFSHISKDKYYWRCKCDCGKETIVMANNLKKGTTTSCGCYKREMLSKEFGISSFNSLYSNYRKRSSQMGFEFKLTKEIFRNLTEDNCYYCGKVPSNILHASEYNGDYIYNGIDRINNDIGYEVGNVVTCCISCNKAKLCMTETEFYDWINRVYDYSIIKNHNGRNILQKCDEDCYAGN